VFQEDAQIVGVGVAIAVEVATGVGSIRPKQLGEVAEINVRVAVQIAGRHRSDGIHAVDR